MTDHKFFAGLTEGMMGVRHASRPNRQQSHFYWPNETDAESPPSLKSRLRNRTMSTASLYTPSQVSTDTEQSRRRKSQQNKSTIEFYDMVDTTTDNESVISRPVDPHKHRKLRTLTSNIEFYDFVDEDKTPEQEKEEPTFVEPPRKEPPVVVEKIEPTPKPQPLERTIPVAMKRTIKSPEIENGHSREELEYKMKSLNLSPEPSNGSVYENYSPPKRTVYEDYSPPKHTDYKERSIKKNSKSSKYVDSFSESEDDEYYHRPSRRAYEMEERKYYTPPPPQRYYSQHSPQRSTYNNHRSHPRPSELEYDDGYRNRRPKNRYRSDHSVESHYAPRVPRRPIQYSPESDEEHYDFDKRKSMEYLDKRSPVTPPIYHPKAPSPHQQQPQSYYPEEDVAYYTDAARRRNSAIKNGYTSEMEQYSRPAPAPVGSVAKQASHSRPESIYSANNRRTKSIINGGYETEQDSQYEQQHRTTPYKPVSRSMSINEAKQRHHVNLKSNIFHNDPEYNVTVEQRRPVTVREAAGSQRVGVGLPDI